jgi:gentisate 1,2-dioxygenase
MHELGRLEDLPQDYRDDLTKLNLVPLWPSLRAVLPPKVPTRKTQPTFWSYQALRPLLLKAGELTPMEKAERRVLVLANPATAWRRCRPAPPCTWACSCCCLANGRPATATRPTRCA